MAKHCSVKDGRLAARYQFLLAEVWSADSPLRFQFQSSQQERNLQVSNSKSTLCHVYCFLFKTTNYRYFWLGWVKRPTISMTSR